MKLALFRNIINMSTLLKLSIFLIILFTGALWSQEGADSGEKEVISPANQALLEVLLSESTEQEIRIKSTQALLNDPESYNRLLEILSHPNHTSARLIICQVIASYNDQSLLSNSMELLPSGFINPLLDNLDDNNPELSTWAARALSKFQSYDVSDILATLASDNSKSINKRLAAVDALKLMSGKSPVIALGQLLQDENTLLKQRASESLQVLLAVDQPIDANEFNENYFHYLQNVPENVFLSKQFYRSQRDLQLQKTQYGLLKNKLNEVMDRHLAVLSQQTLQISDLAQKLDVFWKNLDIENDIYLREWAMEQILQLSTAANVQTTPIAEQLVSGLKGYIQDPEPEIRLRVAKTLENLFLKAQQTAPMLLERLVLEKDANVQTALLSALGTFEYSLSIPQVVLLLRSPDLKVVTQALRTLGNLAANTTNPIDNNQLDQIAIALVGSYRPTLPVDIRKEIIRGMWKITSVNSFQPRAREIFKEILTAALSDSDGSVRSWAVRAHADLYQGQTFIDILNTDNYLLDDTDPTVRFRVIEAIEKYGSNQQLSDLMTRLSKEQLPDTIKAIQSTSLAILKVQTTEIVFNWAEQYQENESRLLTKDEKLLYDQIVDLLWQKISQDKADNIAVPLRYEILALEQLARITESGSQPAQSLGWYTKLLSLSIKDIEKDRYRFKVLNLAIRIDDDALILAATDAANQLKQRENNKSSLNNTLTNFCKMEVSSAGSDVVHHARLMINLLDATKMNDELCQQKRYDLAMKLIILQEQHLADQAKEHKNYMELLSQLDSRMVDYPTDGTVDEKLLKLSEFRTILLNLDDTPNGEAAIDNTATSPNSL